MQAVRFHSYGGPAVLRVERVDVPEPGPGQVLIEVGAAGVTLPVVRLVRGRRGRRGRRGAPAQGAGCSSVRSSWLPSGRAAS